MLTVANSRNADNYKVSISWLFSFSETLANTCSEVQAVTISKTRIIIILDADVVLEGHTVTCQMATSGCASTPRYDVPQGASMSNGSKDIQTLCLQSALRKLGTSYTIRAPKVLPKQREPNTTDSATLRR